MMIPTIFSLPKKPILLSLALVLLSSPLWASLSDNEQPDSDEEFTVSCPHHASQRPLSARTRESVEERSDLFKDSPLEVASFSTPAQIEEFLAFCDRLIRITPQSKRQPIHREVLEAIEQVLALLKREILSQESAAKAHFSLPLTLDQLPDWTEDEEPTAQKNTLGTFLPPSAVRSIWDPSVPVTEDPDWSAPVNPEEEKRILSQRQPAAAEEEDSQEDPEDTAAQQGFEEEEDSEQDPAALWAKEKIEYWGAWSIIGQKPAAQPKGSTFSLLSRDSQGSDLSRQSSHALTEEQFKVAHDGIKEDVRQTLLALVAELNAIQSSSSLKESPLEKGKGLRSLHVTEV